MAETTADVRRDIELTRERMTSTLSQLERKLNLSQVVKDNPWPAIGLAVGAGILLSGSGADVKAAAATTVATRGASSKLGTALDDIVARLMHEVTGAFHGHVDTLLAQVKDAIGAPQDGNGARGFASTAGMGAAGAGAASGMHAGSGQGGMHTGSTPDVGQGGAANPWSTGLGDASRTNDDTYTRSSAGSQAMHNG